MVLQGKKKSYVKQNISALFMNSPIHSAVLSSVATVQDITTTSSYLTGGLFN